MDYRKTLRENLSAEQVCEVEDSFFPKFPARVFEVNGELEVWSSVMGPTGGTLVAVGSTWEKLEESFRAYYERLRIALGWTTTPPSPAQARLEEAHRRLEATAAELGKSLLAFSEGVQAFALALGAAFPPQGSTSASTEAESPESESERATRLA